MLQTVFVGIAAGLAAALLFLAPASGTVLAFPLFALTGLPIAIAGLAWGFRAAAVAAIAGSVVIAAMLSSALTALVFVLLFGAPAVWLSRLVGLSRATDASDPAGPREWFPLSRLLLHASGAIAVAVVIAGLVVGYQPEAMVREATSAVTDWLSATPSGGPSPTADQIEPLMRVYVAVLPFMLGALMVAITVFGLWLASLVARASGRLARPRERLWTIVLRNEILIGFAVALALAFLPGALGDIAGVVAGAFGCALALVGLAVVHALTLGMSGRAPLLVICYSLVILSGLPLLPLAALGAGESFLQLRARRFGRAPPP